MFSFQTARRIARIANVILPVFILSACPSATPAQETCVLVASPQAGEMRRVHLVAESEGAVQIKAPKVGKSAAENAKEAQTTKNDSLRELPLRARGELKYDERYLSIEGPRNRRSLRYHREVAAKVHLADGELTPVLSEDHRWILSDIGPDGPLLVSPTGPLTRDQLDLIHAPLNSLAAELILPGREVRVDETWKIDGDALAILLDLDAVTQTDVAAKLKRIEKGIAVIEFAGKLSAALKGVACDFELVGKANFQVETKAVTWLAISYDEQRAIGHGQPGVKARTRIRMQLQPLQESPELADSVIAELPLDFDDAQKLLKLRSDVGGFEVLLDRNWQVMLERRDVVIMRLVNQGDFVAQANFSPLDSIAPGKQVRLEAFQAEVVSALKNYNATLIEAKEFANPAGLQILRSLRGGNDLGRGGELDLLPRHRRRRPSRLLRVHHPGQDDGSIRRRGRVVHRGARAVAACARGLPQAGAVEPSRRGGQTNGLNPRSPKRLPRIRARG